jgi:hypothetical protein
MEGVNHRKFRAESTCTFGRKIRWATVLKGDLNRKGYGSSAAEIVLFCEKFLRHPAFPCLLRTYIAPGQYEVLKPSADYPRGCFNPRTGAESKSGLLELRIGV